MSSDAGKSDGLPSSGEKSNVSEKVYRQPGLRNVQTTSVFRIVNPELFIRPNKVVMGIGLVAITGCVAYVAYLNATTENKNTYMALDEQGELQKRNRTSRWD